MPPEFRDTPLHCPHFGPCGGCSALDVTIAEQLAKKQQRARELLQPFLGDIDPEITLPPRTPRHDRTSILYPAQERDHELQLGIYQKGTHDIEQITDCRIQHKALTTLAVRVGEVLRQMRLVPYDETSHRGLVRGFRARIMPGTNELLLGIIATTVDFEERQRLGERLWTAAHGLKDDQGRAVTPVGVVLNENGARGNALLGPFNMVQRGRGWQDDSVAGLRLRVSFSSFYQQNRHADAILFRPAMAVLGDVTGLTVVDGYGGVGTFGLRLLKAGAKSAVIIESSPSACEDARVNLQNNNLRSHGEVRQQMFGSAALPECDLIVADPPRAGLGEAGGRSILTALPPRVLLVSCALESLARDLAKLVPSYRVTAMRLCDLFPHTEHIEVVTLLERA